MAGALKTMRTETPSVVATDNLTALSNQAMSCHTHSLSSLSCKHCSALHYLSPIKHSSNTKKVCMRTSAFAAGVWRRLLLSSERGVRMFSPSLFPLSISFVF